MTKPQVTKPTPPTKPPKSTGKQSAAPKKQSQLTTSDLFGSPPTSDPLSGGNLFASTSVEAVLKKEPTKTVYNGVPPGQSDDNDLFASTEEGGGAPPPLVAKKPKTQQTSTQRKTSDSDLFTTSLPSKKEDDPLLSSLPPPTQPKPRPSHGDESIKTPPTKKRPAGAVSLFGGVDLLGGERGLGKEMVVHNTYRDDQLHSFV